MSGILTIIIGLIISPIIGGVMGAFIMSILRLVFKKMSPGGVNRTFKPLQVCAAALMSYSHGANDAQKSMGIITLALLAAGQIQVMEVPLWVKIACAVAMSLGTATGGWRIIKTMGTKIYKLTPMSGFAADINSSITIMAATIMHLPVSTTHVVSGSIMGVGATRRVRAVNWGVGKTMVQAWFMTIPLTAVCGGLILWLLKLVFG